MVESAFDHLGVIDKSGLLLSYPTFDDVRFKFTAEYAHYLDFDESYLKAAARSYFLSLFEDKPGIQMNFEKNKKAGLQVYK